MYRIRVLLPILLAILKLKGDDITYCYTHFRKLGTVVFTAMQLHGHLLFLSYTHNLISSLRDKLSPQVQLRVWYRINVPSALDYVR